MAESCLTVTVDIVTANVMATLQICSARHITAIAQWIKTDSARIVTKLAPIVANP